MAYAAVVVAAGMSSRMGDFKPLMDLGGRPMIDRTVSSLLEGGVSQVVVVAGRRADDLRAHFVGSSVRVVVNECYAQSHMFDSVLLGLSALEGDFEGVLVTPGDIPLVHPSTLRSLMKVPGAVLQPAFCGRAGHPVLLRRKALPYVLAHDGGRGLKGAIESMPFECVLVDVEDEGILLDADIPQDFELLQARLAVSH